MTNEVKQRETRKDRAEIRQTEISNWNWKNVEYVLNITERQIDRHSCEENNVEEI